MGLPYRNEEQKQRWRVYSNNYNKKTYKSINIKLNKITDAREIEYLENSPLGASGEIRKMLKEKLDGKK